MFESTKNFWRHLVGHPKCAGGVALADGKDDRRLWARFPTDLVTVYKVAGAADDAHQPTRVRNVSLGGINLLTTRAQQPGDMLTIELPSGNEGAKCHVLACVVHCVEESTGEWSLGCTFSRQLTETDLAQFGADRKRHSANDQRLWQRIPCNINATYQLVATADQTSYAAKVLNISVTGVGLLVDRAIDNGALLSVELHNAAGTTERTILTCVVHVNPQSDGAWALGCNFIRALSEEDLRALI
ncbi:MAG TPA: PilZ domain-containing protein [Gemmataceae bacterium]|nr:PilZ domain-containing protein [Gemmataceae bacterium]